MCRESEERIRREKDMHARTYDTYIYICVFAITYVCEYVCTVELRKAVPTTLTLRNTNTFPVGFKVKTTSPKSYAVKVR